MSGQLSADRRVRLAHRRDKPEAAIVRTLRLHGWTVVLLTGTPGLPDLLTVRRGQLRLLEVKQKGKHLTPAQVRLHRLLKLAGLTVPVVHTPEEALAALEGTPLLHPQPPQRTDWRGRPVPNVRGAP